MFKRNFFLLLCALGPLFVFANTSPRITHIYHVGLITNDPCDLPAPVNFKVVDIGSTWVSLTWMPSTPGVAHSIKTFIASTNQLVSNIVIPAGSTPSATVTGLQPGITYYSTANAICPDGTDSQYSTITSFFDTIIADLIVLGIQQSNNSPSCGVSSNGQYCEFSLDGSTSIFKIQPIGGGFSRQFNVKKITTPVVRLRGITSSNNGSYYFKIDDQWPNNQGVAGVTYQVFFQGTIIGTFELYEHRNTDGTSVGRLIWTHTNSGYEIVRLSTGPNGLSGPTDPSSGFIRERDGNTSPSAPLATASPNPFSEVLDVYLASTSAENVHLQLFNLSGQQVLSQQFAGGQEQYALSTANLSPGFYMLRIEADGVVQTLKVIKSE